MTNPDVYLTPELARLAAETLDDVFTADGDAGVIDQLNGNATMARLTGRLVDHERWYLVSTLTASLGLLRNAAREAS